MCMTFFLGAVCEFFRLCMKYLGNGWTDLRQVHRKTCLVPRSDELECQCQRSKVKVTRDKFPLRWKRIVTRSLQITSCSRRDHSVATEVGVTGVNRQREWTVIDVAACVWFMFGKASLALVKTKLIPPNVTEEAHFYRPDAVPGAKIDRIIALSASACLTTDKRDLGFDLGLEILVAVIVFSGKIWHVLAASLSLTNK